MIFTCAPDFPKFEGYAGIYALQTHKANGFVRNTTQPLHCPELQSGLPHFVIGLV